MQPTRDLLGLRVLVRLRPFLSSTAPPPPVRGHLVALDPTHGGCMVLLPVDGEDGSDGGSDSGSDGGSDGPAARSSGAAAPDGDANIEQEEEEDGAIDESIGQRQLVVIMGHSIDRIEPDLYSDGFGMVLTEQALERIADQLLGLPARNE
ncbi:hypothetical protein HK105_204920 [Polyrhizophydium stewartii]|uniref:Uncharacterized protein n=1 Tax=Polyrhizophydium stewartii TaxID=2732419 RepID=A0ABR4N7K6_9FUNG